jgi:hypothetical protein
MNDASVSDDSDRDSLRHVGVLFDTHEAYKISLQLATIRISLP